MVLADERRIYYSYIAVYLLGASLIYLGLVGFEAKLIPSAIPRSALSAIGVSFLYVVLLKRFLWRFPPVRLLLGIRKPYIAGRWKGFIRSSYTQHKVEHQVFLEFFQDLDHIRLWYYDEHAVTHSLVAEFAEEPTGGPVRLYCVYRNEPIRTDQKRLLAHTGVMDLLVDQSGRRILGTYYNNPRERRTFGELEVAFVSRRRLGSF